MYTPTMEKLKEVQAEQLPEYERYLKPEVWERFKAAVEHENENRPLRGPDGTGEFNADWVVCRGTELQRILHDTVQTMMREKLI